MSDEEFEQQGLTLSHKVSLFAMFITMTVVLASTGFDEFTQYRRAAADGEEQIKVLGKVTAFSIAAPAMFGDAVAAKSVLDALRAESNVVKAQLIIAEDKPLAVYQRTPTAVDADIERITIPVQWQLQDVGDLVIDVDVSKLNNQLWRQIRFSLFLTLTALLVAGLCVYLMVSIVTKPFRRLADVAERIVSEHDYSLRAVAVSRSDEVGYLTRAFNSMLDSIESQNRDLQDAQKISLGNERRLMLATSAAGLGVWDYDLNAKTVLWDKKMCSIYGVKYNAHGQRDSLFLERLHPDDRDEVIAKYEGVKEQGDELFSVFRIICPDGSIKHVRSNAMLLRDTDGRPSRMIGISLDDTSRELTEAALQNAEKLAQERLSESHIANAKLSFQKRALDEHAIVSISNDKGEITYANEKFCNICGYSRAELIGTDNRLVISDKYQRDFFENIVKEVMSGKIWSGDLENTTKSGDSFWVSATIIPSVSDAGEVASYITIGTDITQIKRAEAALRRSQKMESVGELAGGLAHDFNNLLGIIIGNLDLIGDQVETNQNLKNRLEVAQTAALRGSMLTRSLLDFARKSDGGHRPVDVGVVISGFEELIRKSLTAVVSLETNCSEGLFLVQLNPADLQDALINLSLNARDAMPEGGALVIKAQNVTIDANRIDSEINLEPGDYLEISVGDTGVGMSRELCDKIFDPFFTTKGKAEGTGLGLSIVYGFIQRAKGRIFVFSELGEGAIFKMYFPRATEVIDHQKKPSWSISSHSTGIETILVVDDEVELTVIAKSALEGLGYTVLCANNGDAALDILENNSAIDLVFSDIVMPGGITGLDLAALISKYYPRVKILLTSGFSGEIDSPESEAGEPYKMIKKPYRAMELARRVREALDEPI
jgi:PAS domain S-box-containing protein